MVSPTLTAASRSRARALFFFSALFFGLSALFVRVATHLGGLSGVQVSLARFTVGLVAVLVIFAVRPRTLRATNHPLLAARAIFGGLSGLFYFKAIALIPTGEATLLNNTFPLWGVLLSFFLLRERPTLHLALALVVAGGGVFLVMGGGETRFALGTGQLLALASGVCGGTAVTAIRALRPTHNAATIFFAFSLGGVLASSPALAEPWPTTLLPWGATLAVGLSAFAAQMLMTHAYGTLAVAEAAVWQQLTPISSFAWAMTLGERVTGVTAVGVALGVAGIVYATVLGHVPAAEPAAQPRVAPEG